MTLFSTNANAPTDRPSLRPPGAEDEREVTSADFGRLLAGFETISLGDMANVALLNRTDIKYVMSAEQLYHALAQLTDRYRVLEIEGTALNHYQTLYFDTQDLSLYRRHHDGALNRYKVRSREYTDSHLAFLEVKLKTNEWRTIKSRQRTPQVVTEFGAETAGFLRDHYPYDSQALEPKLWNAFTRITLVSKHRVERLTLDLNLRFHNDDRQASLPGIAIAEVKQEHFSMGSDFIQQMRALNRRPSGFSKYCTGVTLLYPGVKSNNFKPRLLLVNKLVRGGVNHDRVH
jgi:hypothetical protein